jgi:hypothetical protein
VFQWYCVVVVVVVVTTTTTTATTCNRGLHEKVAGPQLVWKFPAFYRTRRFIIAFTSARHLSVSWALGCTEGSVRFRGFSVIKFLRWGIVSTFPNPQAGGRSCIRNVWTHLSRIVVVVNHRQVQYVGSSGCRCIFYYLIFRTRIVVGFVTISTKVFTLCGIPGRSYLKNSTVEGLLRIILDCGRRGMVYDLAQIFAWRAEETLLKYVRIAGTGIRSAGFLTWQRVIHDCGSSLIVHTYTVFSKVTTKWGVFTWNQRMWTTWL